MSAHPGGTSDRVRVLLCTEGGLDDQRLFFLLLIWDVCFFDAEKEWVAGCLCVAGVS